jgi:TetR/AcrR family transcriptional repressor of bet genes
MPRKPNTDTRRAEIVAALLAVISEHGYEKATIQVIAREAGLAPGLIHYHFKNKKEILVDLVKTLAQYARERFLRLAESAKTPQEKLRAYIQGRLARGEGSNPDAVAAWVIIGAEAVRQVEVREVYQEAIASEMDAVRHLLEAYLAERGKRRKNAPRLAAALLAFMEGAFQLASAARDVMPSGYAAETAMQLAERFIDGEPDAGKGRRQN